MNFNSLWGPRLILYVNNSREKFILYPTEPKPRGRMTPAKYTIPHMCVRFGPGGQLVKVMPNRPADGQPATVEIHEVNEMLQENPETEELKAFPGPLIR